MLAVCRVTCGLVELPAYVFYGNFLCRVRYKAVHLATFAVEEQNLVFGGGVVEKPHQPSVLIHPVRRRIARVKRRLVHLATVAVEKRHPVLVVARSTNHTNHWYKRDGSGAAEQFER